MEKNDTKTDNQTLVDFLKFKKDEEFNINYTNNGYQPETILKYWSIE